jgi:hypothetical protein
MEVYTDEDEIAYDRGWDDGYYDRLPDNPYTYGSYEWEKYIEGYEEGFKNS